MSCFSPIIYYYTRQTFHTFPNYVDWNKVLRLPTEMDIVKLVTILCHFKRFDLFLTSLTRVTKLYRLLSFVNV